MNRIKPRLVRARIPPDGAALARARLGGCVRDVVAVSVAASLEGVVQSEPVADLVRGDVSQVEVCLAAARERRRLDAAAVHDVDGRAGRGVLGEVAVAQPIVVQVLDDVEVERPVGTQAQLPLHGQFLAVVVVGPDGVDGTGGALVGELDSVGLVSVVEDGQLLRQSCVL